MKILSKEKGYNGYFKVNKIVVENSDGTKVNREQFELHNAVAALVYDYKNEEFIFVKQFRIGPESHMLEVPAGKMDIDGETPEETVKREILEEIGYEVESLDRLHTYYPAPGSSTEKIYLFYATVSNKIEEGGGVESEDIEIVKMSKYELERDFKAGKFQDGKSIIAIQNFLYR